MSSPAKIAAVIIGRNEGQRFLDCLASLPLDLAEVVYVDSGSTDGSVEAAREHGAKVVTLTSALPFTAARARNSGLHELSDDTDYVQFIDGDCALRDGWMETAAKALDTNETLAVVCGRRRERHPDVSVYNRLCDWEWDTPVGPATACGGDAMMRLSALREVKGYDPRLIAGEEPELCVRLRQAGWGIERLDAEMTWHDAAMTTFGQWWKRAKRAGHAFAEGSALHGAPPERHWVRERNRALVWGAALPALIVVLAFLHPMISAALALAYPAQMIRLALKDAEPGRWERAFFTVFGKFPEAQGAIGYYLSWLLGRRQNIIEYK